MGFIKFYFSFQGRINRKEFWLKFILPVFLLIGLAFYLDPNKKEALYANILGLSLLWPGLAIQAKRWHDIDKSAWWILINFVPFGSIYALIANGFFRGTEGNNRFGIDPLSNDHTSDRVSLNAQQLIVEEVKPTGVRILAIVLILYEIWILSISGPTLLKFLAFKPIFSSILSCILLITAIGILIRKEPFRKLLVYTSFVSIIWHIATWIPLILETIQYVPDGIAKGKLQDHPQFVYVFGVLIFGVGPTLFLRGITIYYLRKIGIKKLFI